MPSGESYRLASRHCCQTWQNIKTRVFLLFLDFLSLTPVSENVASPHDHLVDPGHHGENGTVCDERGVNLGLGQRHRHLLATVVGGALGHDHLHMYSCTGFKYSDGENLPETSCVCWLRT